MGIQIRPLMRSTANAASLGDYLAADEDLDAPSPNASPGAIGVYLAAAAERCIAEAHQVHGGASEALGLAGRTVTLAHFSNMLEGRHVETGEQLTRSRAAPVYQRDHTGRLIKDENGQRIRVLDSEGEPKLSRDNELLGIEIITEHSPAIRCLLVAAEAAGATHEVERIKETLAQVNQDFLAYIQQNVPLVRRTIPASMARAEAEKAGTSKGGTAVLTKPETKQQGSKTVYVPGELAIIAVPQWTARSNAETDQRPSGMPDPAPHTHNIFAPVAYLPGVDNDPVFGTQPGRFAKLDEYQLLKRAGELSAVHDGMTHRAMTSLGYETETLVAFDKDPNGRHRWTIKGINPAAEDFFSSNSRRLPTVVAEWEAKTGRTASPAMRTLLMRSTKGTKHKAQDSNPDWSHWVSDATAAGIEVASKELREKLMASSARRVERAPHHERVAELRRRLDSDNGFHKDHATFTAVEARTTLMRAAEGLDFELEDLEVIYADVMSDKTAVIALNPYKDDGTPQDYNRIVYTTPRMLAAEHQVAAVIRYKSKATFRGVSPKTASKVLAANAHLDAQQRRVYSAITAGRGLVMIEGPAGTGKTSSVRSAVEALRAGEQINRVVVVSTAARTAAETGRKLGAEAAGPIEQITTAVSNGSLQVDEKTLVVIDEAAMVDTARMERIASTLGAGRWVMTGDPHQMQPVGPGGWYQDVQVAHPTSIYQLTEVHRHVEHADTLAYNALRDGRPDEYLDSMERRGRLFIDNTEQDTWDRITRNYAACLDVGYRAQDVRIVAAGGSNRELDSWNRAVQNMRIHRGEIDPKGFDMVSTQTNRSWRLHSGDVVMFIANLRSAEGEHMRNGVAGIAREVDSRTGRAVIELHDGRSVTLNLQRTAKVQPVSPAYAVHTAKFQGGETKLTHQVSPSPERLQAFSAYTASTRAEQATYLYLNKETHGEQAKENVAEALKAQRFPQTAQSLDQRSGPISAVSIVSAANATRAAELHRAELGRRAVQERKIEKAREAMRLSAIKAVIGHREVLRVRQAPGWKDLNNKLNQLAARGLDERAMFVRAARQPGLTNAADPAAELTQRLDRVEEKPRARREPAVLGLVGPSGPDPRSRLSINRNDEKAPTVPVDDRNRPETNTPPPQRRERGPNKAQGLARPIPSPRQAPARTLGPAAGVTPPPPARTLADTTPPPPLRTLPSAGATPPPQRREQASESPEDRSARIREEQSRRLRELGLAAERQQERSNDFELGF